MNEVIISKVKDNIVATVRVDKINEIDLNKTELFLFSEKVNDYVKIEFHDVVVLGLSNKSNNSVEKSKLLFIKKYFSHIQKIILGTHTYEDISILYNLKSLRSFKSQGMIKSEFNFKELPKLENVFIHYQKSMASIFECSNLKEIEMHKYKGKKSDKFEVFRSARSLVLRQFNMIEIEEIGKLPRLDNLEISHNRVIDNLKSLNYNSTIKKLHVMNCPKIKDFSSLSGLGGLRSLIMENQKEITNLSFVNEMPNLRSLAILGSSNVLDGKLKWLLNIPNLQLSCEIKKHYDIEWSEDKNGNFIISDKK